MSGGVARSFALGAVVLLAVSVVASACSSGGGAGAASTATMTEQEEIGRRLFSTHCASCHATAPEVVIVGPSLAGIASRAERRMQGVSAEAYLQRSLMAPGEYVVEGFSDLMPKDLGASLSSEEREALLAYLLTLE